MKSMKKKKKNKKNKGFTLVELLVAISILGIIMVIALPQLSNIQENNKTTKYKKYSDTMLTSGKLYTDAYTEDMFGNNKSGCVDVPYDDMKDKDLLKDIKADGSTCKSNKTYIRVRKANDHYFYETSISCKDKNGKVVYEELLPENACNGNEPDESGPHIIITPNSKNWTKGTNEKVKVNIWDEYGMLENTKVKLSWIKSDGTVYGTEKTHDFKNKRYDASTETNALEVEIDVPQNQTGIFKLKVTPIDVRDSLGNYQSNVVISGEYKLDNKPPTVPSTIYMYKWTTNGTEPTDSTGLTAYENDTWSNKYIYTYPGTSTDEHVKGVYYQYKTSGDIGTNSDSRATSKSINKAGLSTIAWRACDQLGNCSAYTTENTIKIDIIKPTVESVKNSSKDKWTKENVIIEANANDQGGSDVAAIYYYYDTDPTYRDDWDLVKKSNEVKGTWSAERNNIVSIVAVDHAGNESSPSFSKVKIDKTPPTCENSGGNTTWTKENITITGTCSDGASGCATNASYTFDVTTSTTTASPGSVTDKAGNTATCPSDRTVYVDKTAPTLISVSNPKENTATLAGLQVTVSGSDDHSGIGKWQWKEGNGSWVDIDNSNYTPYVDTYTAERNATTCSYRLCDAVGNCSTSKSTVVQIVNPCAAGYTKNGTYGEWTTCTKSCGTEKKYRTINLVSTLDESISCGTGETQEEADCGLPSCEHKHSYGSSYNHPAGNFEWGTVNWTEWSNCTHKTKTEKNEKGEDVKVGIGVHKVTPNVTQVAKAKCTISGCGYVPGWLWCPCSYGSTECSD